MSVLADFYSWMQLYEVAPNAVPTWVVVWAQFCIFGRLIFWVALAALNIFAVAKMLSFLSPVFNLLSPGKRRRRVTISRRPRENEQGATDGIRSCKENDSMKIYK